MDSALPTHPAEAHDGVHLGEADAKPTHCPACHYPRHGLDREDCPECGTPFIPEPLTRAERERRRGKAIRLVAVIVAIQLLLSLFPFVLVLLWFRSP